MVERINDLNYNKSQKIEAIRACLEEIGRNNVESSAIKHTNGLIQKIFEACAKNREEHAALSKKQFQNTVEAGNKSGRVLSANQNTVQTIAFIALQFISSIG